MNFIPLEKQSKKNRKGFAKKQRNTNGFNTGTRVFKSKKKYDRKRDKKQLEI